MDTTIGLSLSLAFFPCRLLVEQLSRHLLIKLTDSRGDDLGQGLIYLKDILLQEQKVNSTRGAPPLLLLLTYTTLGGGGCWLGSATYLLVVRSP